MGKKTYYQTITAPSEGVYKEKGSKFIAYAFPIHSREEAMERLQEVKKWHIKARHHCFAWRLGYTGDLFRAADDGEPSGTAGKPILGQIDKFNLTNVMVVVVRYFGGTLLGTSGLIRSYREATADAFAKAEIKKYPILDVYRISFGYDLMSQTMSAVKKSGLKIIKQEFTDNGKVELGIPFQEVDEALLKLKAGISQVSTNQASMEDWPEGVKVELVRKGLDYLGD
ncbi:MAG TPA: YigZ family protein [Saprospiraceae bacterium]|nr:YigZ family protein [Saprospiraceae bacterium]